MLFVLVHKNRQSQKVTSKVNEEMECGEDETQLQSAHALRYVPKLSIFSSQPSCRYNIQYLKYWMSRLFVLHQSLCFLVSDAPPFCGEG